MTDLIQQSLAEGLDCLADGGAENAIDRPIPLRLVSKILPGRSGRPISKCSLWRWSTKGVSGAGGRHARLETYRIGGTRYTTVAAVLQFAYALDGRAYADHVAARIRQKRRMPPANLTDSKKIQPKSHVRSMEFLRQQGLLPDSQALETSAVVQTPSDSQALETSAAGTKAGAEKW